MSVTTAVPPRPDQLAAAQRQRQQAIAGQAMSQTSGLWAFLAVAGWLSLRPRILSILRAAMAEAGRGAQPYVAAVAAGWSVDPDPLGTVNGSTFAATASDGRDLGTLLDQPAREVEAFVSQGMAAGQARAIGERHMLRIVQTQVQDASRVSVGVAITNDRRMSGYIRHLTLPSCSRCIILSGRWYRYSSGFQRHPQCDCVMLPAAEPINPPSPREVYDSLSDEERRKAGWSGHDQRAIDDGASLNQVTNYRRELKSVSVAGHSLQTTTVGTTRRGIAGKRLGANRKVAGERYRRTSTVRLTPESIYAEAERLGWSRDEVIRQLKRFGYIL